MRTRAVAAVAVVVTAAAACGSGQAEDYSEVRAALDDNVAFVSEDWPTDWSNATIGLDELILGVSATEPRDAIPPIDEPRYESVADAASWLDDREPGALVQIEGDVRFYPLSIMTRHEIVNDEVGGIPVAVTYCPLCNTALAFDRRVDGRVLRFGVSGLLRNSDLVMWDEATVSLWQQITGEAVVGEFAGTVLEPLSTAIVGFGAFREEFPAGRSLSRDTGFALTYGVNPYEGYSARVAPRFPVAGERDGRFMALERVVGVSVGGRNRAYPFSLLSDLGVVNDVVGGVPVVVWWGSPDTADALDRERVAEGRAIGTALALDPTVEGEVLTFTPDEDSFVDAETGSRWTLLGLAVEGPLTGTRLETVPHRNEFWFARTAFFQDDEVFED